MSNPYKAKSSAAGNWFGKYELLSTIGSGGMATVYRASLRGPGSAARPVALKMIHPHLSEERKFVLMFLDEMRVAMAFTHRNIVQTFDAGKVDDRYYMVMELIDGCSLRAFLSNIPEEAVPIDIALFIGMELASALAYAHSFRPELTGQPAAVVHRDISPSNILLARDGGVKLADFGVARAMDALGNSSVGVIKGKLSYMAPEQARGSAERRSDIFATGIVLYEMLSGQLFRPSATLEEVLSGPVEMKPLRTLRKSVPAEVEALIQRCLDPNPSGRPDSANALREELSEAYFRLQTNTDPHARLGKYLEQLPTLAKPKDASKDKIAAAILAEVKGVPTARRLPEDAPQNTLPTVRQTPASHDDTTDEGVSTRWQLALAFGGALLLGGIIGLLYLMPDDNHGEPVTTLTDKAEPLLTTTTAGAGKATTGKADTGTKSAADVQTVDARSAPLDVAVAKSRIDSAAAKRPPPRRRGIGQLVLNSLPWSKVYVDGRYRGNTPLEGLKLRAGRHKIRLVSPGRGLSRTFTIQIRAGAVLRKVVDLNEP